MIAVFPIWIEDEDPIWQAHAGRRVITQAVEAALHSQQIAEVFVLTNNLSVKELFGSFDVSTHLVDLQKDIEDPQILPQGTADCLRYLNEVLQIPQDDLMIVNFRNPLLTTYLIGEAVAQFMCSDGPALISVRESVDHPCQLKTYFDLIDLGMIHFFDDTQDVEPYRERLLGSFRQREASTKAGSGRGSSRLPRSRVILPSRSYRRQLALAISRAAAEMSVA